MLVNLRSDMLHRISSFVSTENSAFDDAVAVYSVKDGSRFFGRMRRHIYADIGHYCPSILWLLQLQFGAATAVSQR